MAEALQALIWNGKTTGARRFALKVESVALQYGKSPIQVGIPFNDPLLIDLNIVRPTITLTLLVDRDITNQTITGPDKGNGTNYKVPTKQDLEDFITDNGYTTATESTLMLLQEDGTYEQYIFAIQQFTVNLAAVKEDRYETTLVMLTGNRAGDFSQVTTW